MEEERLLDLISQMLEILGTAFLEVSSLLEQTKIDLLNREKDSFKDSTVTRVIVAAPKKTLQTSKKTVKGRKGPHTAFNFFQKEMLEKVKNDVNYKGENLSVTLGRLWRACEDRSHYIQLAEEDKLKFECDLQSRESEEEKNSEVKKAAIPRELPKKQESLENIFSENDYTEEYGLNAVDVLEDPEFGEESALLPQEDVEEDTEGYGNFARYLKKYGGGFSQELED